MPAARSGRPGRKTLPRSSFDLRAESPRPRSARKFPCITVFLASPARNVPQFSRYRKGYRLIFSKVKYIYFAVPHKSPVMSCRCSIGDSHAFVLLPSLLVLAILVFCVSVGGAQQSYRTQHSLQQRRPLQQKSLSGSRGSEAGTRPLRFLGWRQAMRQGPQAVRHFQSLLSPSPHRRIQKYANAGTDSSRALNLSAASSTPAFSPAQLPGILLRPSLPAGALPTGVVVGDFNGDGKLDWVVANGGDNTLDVYLGGGNGTSRLPSIIPLSGQSPVGIAAADLNGDGKLDLAVVESDSNTVGIVFGNGDGTFRPEIELPVANAQPLAIAIADVNKDGKPDLIVAILGSGPATQLDFEILLNDGTGHFGSPIYAPPLISDGIDEGFAISVGDLNGDGIPDLLVTGADAFTTTVKTYFGNGDGSFTAGALVGEGSPIAGADIPDAVLADVNGDNCADIIDVNTAGYVDVFYGTCSGTFPSSPSAEYGIADAGGSLVVADVNGDGFPDIITGSFPNPNAGAPGGYSPGDSLTVRLNDGTGKFGPARVYAGDPGMFALAEADLKNDGLPDVVTANQNTNTATVFENDGSGGYGEPVGGYAGFHEGGSSGPTNAPFTSYLSADVDGDGKQDLVLVESPFVDNSDLDVTTILNQGNGQFSLPIRSPLIPFGPVVQDFVMADFRKVGRPDFLALMLGASSPELIYAENTGGGNFGPAVTIPFPVTFPYAFGTLAIADFNNDGRLDFAVCASDGGSNGVPTSDALMVYLGKGDGTFTASPFQLNFAQGENCPAMFVGDSGPNVFMWLQNNSGPGSGLYEAIGHGDGTFSPPTEAVPLSTVARVSMADLNHDGKLDLVDIESGPNYGYVGATPPQINIYLGRSGGFSGPVTYSPYAGLFAASPGSGLGDDVTQSFGPYLGDFNGDGNLDIAVFQYPPATLFANLYTQFLIGNGDGTFTPSYDVFPFTFPVPDLAAYNLFGDARTALLQDAGFTSSYQLFPSAPAPFIQARMDETPVISGNDAVEISIDVPSSADTIVSLSTSDPNVQIPASVTIPAGQVSVEVPFSLASSMPVNQWFAISAQSNGTTAIAYNFEPAAGASAPFVINVFGGFTTPADDTTPGPGQSSVWMANLTSTGLASSTFQLSCSGLPATASCASFSPASLAVWPGTTVGSSFTIITDPSIKPGIYPFTLAASDGFTSFASAQSLRIGDFSLTLQPASLTVPPTGTANFTLNMMSQFGYGDVVMVNCSNLPSGASCASAGQAISYGQQQFAMNLNHVAAGTYSITVTGTSPALSHSITEQLQVTSEAIASLDQSALSFPVVLVRASSSPQTVTLTNAGNAALSVISIAATTTTGGNNAFTETNNCGASVSPAASCAINVTFSPTAVGSATGTLTITDNAAGSPHVVTLSGTAADFSIGVAAGGSTSASIAAGDTAVYSLQIEGNQLSGTVALSCSNAPPDAVCTLNPSGVAVAGSTPAPFQVRVSTIARSSVLPWRQLHIGQRASLEVCLIGSIIFFVLAALLALAHRRGSYRYLFPCVLIAVWVAMSGCGGGGGRRTTGTPAGTYAVTITGQCENGARTASLTLTVQ